MSQSTNKKVVYIAGAIRRDREVTDAIQHIVGTVQSLGLTLLNEQIDADDPLLALAQKMGKLKEQVTARDIEEQDITWLDQSTHVIAEVSDASTGTGREIEYARTKGSLGKTSAHILCLYQAERELLVSPMIRGMDSGRYPNIVLGAYKNIAEAEKMIATFLE